MKKSPPSQGDLFGAAPAPVPPKPPAPVAAPPAPRAPAPALPERPSPVERPTPAWRAAAPEPKVLSVGELTWQIKNALERGFTRVTVRGEVSGYRGPNARGHLYFALKDAEAMIDARIWANMASRLRFKLKEGLSVVVEGTLDVYAPQGRYSLIVQRIEPEGVGALALAFEQLKERLSAEGLFGDRRLRPPRALPFLPRRIGVVTSVTGAALRDFLRVLHNRHPHLSVLICDARVQGEGSAREVVRAIEWLSQTDVDVVVVTRGGGSIEDLWTFNEEAVARAIHACPVPVVSAIGHEVDFTIADFVADFRAPTPSAAAERLAPVLRDLELQLATGASRLTKAAERAVLDGQRVLAKLAARLPDPRRALGHQRLHLSERAERMSSLLRRRVRVEQQLVRQLSERLQGGRPQARLAQSRERLNGQRQGLVEQVRARMAAERERLYAAKESLARESPRHRLRQESNRLGYLRQRLESASSKLLEQQRSVLMRHVTQLEAMSPLAVMTRGYAVAFKGRGIVRRASDVQVGDVLELKLAPTVLERLEDADVLEAQVTAVRAGPQSAKKE